MWGKLDGKKTVSGVILALVAIVLNQFGVLGEDQFNTLIEIAGVVAGVGVLHKGYKGLRGLL